MALEAELAAQRGGVARAQHAQVHAGLGDADAVARGAVQAHQVPGLGDAAGHETVGGGHQGGLGR